MQQSLTSSPESKMFRIFDVMGAAEPTITRCPSSAVSSAIKNGHLLHHATHSCLRVPFGRFSFFLPLPLFVVCPSNFPAALHSLPSVLLRRWPVTTTLLVVATFVFCFCYLRRCHLRGPLAAGLACYSAASSACPAFVSFPWGKCSGRRVRLFRRRCKTGRR